MKKLLKSAAIIVLATTLNSCSQEDKTNHEMLNQQEEIFAAKTFEILELLTSEYFPQEDVKFIVYKDNDGFLSAKYEVVGETKKEIEMGSFVGKQSFDDNGTNCKGKWSCGRAIYKCLENGKDALISVGKCKTSYANEYCVTCQDPK